MPEYQQPVTQDAYGHLQVLTGQQLTGASSGTVAGTIVTGAIGSGTPTVVNAVDMAGSFTITGTAASGVIATVFFLNPLPGAPKAIEVSAVLAAGGAVAGIPCAGTVNAGLTSLTINGGAFTAAAYSVYYMIVC